MSVLPKGFWGEHGAWAMVLTSLGAGLAAAWPAAFVPWLLLPCVVLLTGAKGMAQRARRSGSGYGPPAFLALAGGSCALPAVLAAPVPFLIAALLVAPFAWLYVLHAASPAWTRSLPVEVLGALYAALAGPMALVAGRPGAPMDAACLWAALAVLFLPGVLRARMRKDSSSALRWATAGSALLGAAVWGGLPLSGLVARWGFLGAVVFLGDLWAAWALPEWRVRTMGIVFTLRYAAAALILALAWRPMG